jgi:hypothetical protein
VVVVVVTVVVVAAGAAAAGAGAAGVVAGVPVWANTVPAIMSRAAAPVESADVERETFIGNPFACGVLESAA